MTQTEALRLALEALENLGNHDRVCPQWPTYAEPENYPKCNCGYDQAITEIKAALEAKDDRPLCTAAMFDKWFLAKSGLDPNTPLYTTPQQRTWHGLTNEQYLEACKIAEGGNYMVAFQRIQQWLMENNT